MSRLRGRWLLRLTLVWLALPARAEDGGAPASAPVEVAADAGLAAPASRPASEPALAPDTGAGPSSAPSWLPRLRATVKPAQAHVGDPVTVTLTVTHRKGVSVNLPLQLELGKFSELKRSESTRDLPAKEQGGIPDVERVFVLQVAAYELGQLTLPPVEITALGPGGEMVTLKTEPLPIQIRSVMANEPKPKARDLEPPVPVYQRTWWLIYTLIGLLVVALSVVVTLMVARHLRARRERLKPPPPPTPAHVVALRRLAELDVEAYIADERFKELYLALSEIMREYVGRRWGFDALEMTTSEVGQALERASVAGETRRQLLEAFDSWDLVKFAKYRPDAQRARDAAQLAEQVVRSTSLLAASGPVAAAGDAGGAAPAASPAGSAGGDGAGEVGGGADERR